MHDKFTIVPPSECPHLIIDMDEVVADTLPPILAELNRINGTSITEDQITNYDFSNFFDVDHDMIHQIFLDNNILETVAPFPNIEQSLRRLRSMGYKLHFVTARAWHPKGVNITMDWLDKHAGGLYDSVSVSYGRTQEKSDVYKTIAREFAYIVDDGMHNILDAAQSGLVREFCVIRAPWNAIFNEEYEWKSRMFDSLEDFTNKLEEGLQNVN